MQLFENEKLEPDCARGSLHSVMHLISAGCLIGRISTFVRAFPLAVNHIPITSEEIGLQVRENQSSIDIHGDEK